ncbi:MAG: probable oxidoreductase [uncultured Nocardioidaceae bacterium]|uniref:Probable oxidoreductase n=1 Tax=uncultured Nocardioidaceae bacterium TaxID=253824 RepID=A0A6J4MYC5_9ACTN|nr:MAG: probable oxidoreductase [uncultured Nocardioidaceae bacterium]
MDPLADLAALEGVGSAMAAGRDGIDALLRDRGLRRTAPELTAESLLLGARASAVLEGSSATVDELREGPTDDVSAAALRVSTEVLGLVPVLAHSPLQAFARLHMVAAKGVLADSDLGKPRDPAAAERLSALGRLLLGRSSAPALVAAAVVHAELVTVAPFSSHNGIVARAAERLVMVARGVDPTSLTVPEAGHLALRPQYESNLIGYVEGGAVGVHAWLLYAAEAYTAGAQASPLRG